MSMTIEKQEIPRSPDSESVESKRLNTRAASFETRRSVYRWGDSVKVCSVRGIPVSFELHPVAVSAYFNPMFIIEPQSRRYVVFIL